MSRILIIEDEEAIADLEKDYLELSGFEVEIENRGDTGLVRAMKEEFDLIILDLMLPEYLLLHIFELLRFEFLFIVKYNKLRSIFSLRAFIRRCDFLVFEVI